jgi:hypothetical protein
MWRSAKVTGAELLQSLAGCGAGIGIVLVR